MTNIRRVCIFAFSCGVLFVPFKPWAAQPAVAANVLSLKAYLGQVKKANNGVRASVLNAKGDRDTIDQGDLPYVPDFFTSLRYVDDQRQTLVPVFEGTRTVNQMAEFGVEKLFDFGLRSKLFYSVSPNAVYGVSPQLVPENSLITSGLTLQLTEPLWQNAFGREDRDKKRAERAENLSKAYNESFALKTSLAEARSRYWALAVDREIVKVEQASTERTKVIESFDLQRFKSHLINKSDLLASEAQTKAKEFDLQNAIDNEQTARISFNAARGIHSDQVPEKLAFPSVTSLEQMTIPRRVAMRDDVKAAKQSNIALNAQRKASTQSLLPQLNLTASASTNGLDPNLTTSVNKTLTTHYRYYSVGVDFRLPLDFGLAMSLRKASEEKRAAAELNYQERLFDQETEWQRLVTGFKQAQERLALAIDVEEAQKDKFDHERRRQRMGVTTAYRVFQYEMDYLNSELTRIQTEALILNLKTQMSTYQ